MPRPRHILEYALLRAATAVLNLLPLDLARAVAWLALRAAFDLLRFRRAETRRRIRRVFGPDLPAAAVRRIAWRSLRNVGFNAVEMMRADRLDAAWMRGHVAGHDEAIGQVREMVARHGGVVIAVPHMGNWDLAGLACRHAGLAIFSVAARQRNPLVNDWMNRRRSVGLDVLERGSGTLRQVVARLRAGGAFAILPDVRMRQPDLTVPFLGAEANLGRGMALFARTAGVPILPVLVTRVGWGRQRFEPRPPVHPDPSADKESDALRMTRTVMAHIDKAIRNDPGQWFWYNKRWVLEPVAAGEAVPVLPPDAGGAPA